ncbi:MAG: DUF4388 domain-containing protein [Thermoanaerobaculia bacterium]
MDLPGGPKSGELAETPILDVVRSIHVAGGSGTLEIDAAGQKRRLFFRSGQLFLAASHPLARKLGNLVERLRVQEDGKANVVPTVEQTEARKQVLEIVQRMAQVVADWREGSYSFDGSESALPAELVGPLPTSRLVMEGATIGLTESALVDRLGGPAARLVSVRPREGTDALGWTPEELFLAERLSQPMTVEAILSESPVSRLETLVRLVQLKAALRVRIFGRSDSGSRATGSLESEMAKKLYERFERDVREVPLKLPVDAYRARIADLLGRLGGMNAYELLGIEASASSEVVQAKYEELARLSHPVNEKNYGLEGLSQVLEMLFERATQSFLTLSEPERRRRYNEAQEIEIRGSTVTGAQRDVERTALARQHYEQGLSLAARGDFHFAIELLQLAVKVDRKAEYLLALARLQAKNPNWAKRAIETCRAALEIDPHSADARFQLGELYEQGADFGRARAQYTAAVRENPNHLQALAKLRELQESQDARKATGGGLFDRLFGRRDEG